MLSWLSLLNPLNWIKILGLLKSLFDMVSAGVKAFNDWMLRRSIDKKNAAVDQAAEQLKKADEVMDDKQRLEAKADAACDLEKLADPHSDCK